MSENRKLYIADWHYAHANILAFDNRPFKTVEKMNEELVKRWNAKYAKSYYSWNDKVVVMLPPEYQKERVND